VSERLTVVARIRAKPGKEKETHAALRALLAPTQAEAGCLNYDMHESLDDPAAFLFYENWESRAHLDAHIKTPHVQSFFDRASELLAEPVEIKFYRMVSPPGK